MAVRLIQKAMRIAALLLVLAMGLAPVRPAAAADEGISVAAFGEGCGASFGELCLRMCRQAPAGERGHQQIGAQPATPCGDAATGFGAAPIAWHGTWSASAAPAVGPPAYLSYRRLLL